MSINSPLRLLGAHSFLWASEFQGAHADVVAAGVASAGLGLVEIPLLDPTAVEVDTATDALARHGLTPTCSLGLPAAAHAPDAPGPALEFLRVAIDTAAALGSSWLTGALYGHLGTVSGAAPTQRELDVVADVLRDAADHASERGVRLGIEVINRYETHLVNTASAAKELLMAIDRPGTVFAHLDTFHMHIEEDDIGGAVRLLGDDLGYLHLAESTRGVIGSGTFRFDELLSALSDIGFSGPAVIEAFVHGPPDLLRTTASWRRPTIDGRSFVEQCRAALDDAHSCD